MDPQKFNTELPHDPAVLLAVDSKEWKAETQTDIIILNYVLYLINVGIFPIQKTPK